MGEYEEFDGDEFDEEDEQGWVDNNKRYGGQHRGVRNREYCSLGSTKMKIPSFQGKNDPKAYLEREKKME